CTRACVRERAQVFSRVYRGLLCPHVHSFPPSAFWRKRCPRFARVYISCTRALALVSTRGELLLRPLETMFLHGSGGGVGGGGCGVGGVLWDESRRLGEHDQGFPDPSRNPWASPFAEAPTPSSPGRRCIASHLCTCYIAHQSHQNHQHQQQDGALSRCADVQAVQPRGYMGFDVDVVSEQQQQQQQQHHPQIGTTPARQLPPWAVYAPGTWPAQVCGGYRERAQPSHLWKAAITAGEEGFPVFAGVQQEGGLPYPADPVPRRSRKRRVPYSKAQLRELEAEFGASRFVSRERRRGVAASTQLNERQVTIWFQNRRVKEKKIAVRRVGSASGVKSSSQGIGSP
uniref:Homeobox domain-containing protein n=1 Tax=Petromyzon marinus TaxID=7757 RepID=S4R6K8_PETMA